MQENQRLKIESEGKNYIWEIPGYDQYQISSRSIRTRRGNKESYTKDKLSCFRDVAIPLSYWEKHSRHRRHWVIDGNYYFSEGSRPQKVSLHKKATLARLAPASKTFLLLERDLSQGKFPSTNNGKTAKPAVFMGEASDHQKNKRSLLPLDIFLMFFCGLQPASICCYTYNTFW